MEITTAREQLILLQKKNAAYTHALELLFYDGATTAPKKTAQNRAHTIGILSEEIYNLSTGEETVALLEFLDAHREQLDEKEQRMVDLMIRDIRKMKLIPMEEYIAYQKLLVEADAVWHEAKEKSDFAMFEPVLEQIFEMNKKIAGYCAPGTDPYEYWLNEYEEGLTKDRCEAFFQTLKEHIVPLLSRVMKKEQLSRKIVEGDFAEYKQEKLAKRVMEIMGLDLDHVGIGTTEHPFTISLGSHFDERITTNYKRDDLASSLFSVIHEGGHALYDTGSDDSLAYTVLDGGVSMGIHESQSRFYENILGRSRAFICYLMPVLKDCFPDEMKDYDAEDLYRAVNRAEPSLIRTEADELTYCLHIMIRYELEKKVMAGELSVHDLPLAWNALYQEYLGVEVPDDRSGVLQDSHWSGGSIGYFPSYALGSAYGAQFLKKMKETVDVDGDLARGDFTRINEWNREHIWQYGSLYKPAELFKKVTGEEFDPTVFTKYLEEKYTDLYQLDKE